MTLNRYRSKLVPAQMKKNRSMGTSLNFGICPEIMSILRRSLGSSRSGLVDVIVGGRGNGVFMVAAWLMFQVSPSLSGNYYVYDYAGDFPRRGVEGFSRKGLRNRIGWAEKRAIEKLHPEFTFRYEKELLERMKPVNTSKDLKLRPYDIPIIAWKKQALMPTGWKELAQIHREPTYRLKRGFAQQSLPSLLALGRILRRVFLDNPQVTEYLKEPLEVWSRLKQTLEQQHREMRTSYDESLRIIDGDMQKSLGEEARVAFLAFSITDFRPKYHL